MHCSVVISCCGCGCGTGAVEADTAGGQRHRRAHLHWQQHEALRSRHPCCRQHRHCQDRQTEASCWSRRHVHAQSSPSSVFSRRLPWCSSMCSDGLLPWCAGGRWIMWPSSLPSSSPGTLAYAAQTGGTTRRQEQRYTAAPTGNCGWWPANCRAAAGLQRRWCLLEREWQLDEAFCKDIEERSWERNELDW